MVSDYSTEQWKMKEYAQSFASVSASEWGLLRFKSRFWQRKRNASKLRTPRPPITPLTIGPTWVDF